MRSNLVHLRTVQKLDGKQNGSGNGLGFVVTCSPKSAQS